MKLWQFDLADRTHVRIDSNKMKFVADAVRPGVEVMPLFHDERSFARTVASARRPSCRRAGRPRNSRAGRWLPGERRDIRASFLAALAKGQPSHSNDQCFRRTRVDQAKSSGDAPSGTSLRATLIGRSGPQSASSRPACRQFHPSLNDMRS